MLSNLPKALIFDVFGTCVNWRKTVTETLHHEYQAATSNTSTTTATQARQMSLEDWEQFATQWRTSYGYFTQVTAQQPGAQWKTIDEFHLESLRSLLAEWELTGLWSDEKIREINLVWHKLEPWKDTSAGITELNKITQTGTLSNGNTALLEDLCKSAKMDMQHLFSAETFRHYKPHPATYLGAVKKLGLEPGEVAMVAAHLGDLEAAKKNGLKTIYVEREREENWEAEKVRNAKADGWVDVWVGEDEDGFLKVAEHLANLEKGRV